MSERMIFAERQVSNFSAISWHEQITVWDNDGNVSFVLDQHAYLDLYSASSLKQQSVDKHVASLRQIILILGQPVFVLTPKCWCFGLTRPGLEPTICPTQDEQLTITPQMQFITWCSFIWFCKWQTKTNYITFNLQN